MIGLEEMEEREEDLIESLLTRTCELMRIDPDDELVLKTLAVNTAILEHMMITYLILSTPTDSFVQEIERFHENLADLKQKLSSKL